MHRAARVQRFRALIICRNVICQRLINGEQCHNFSVIMHHLVSPVDAPHLQLVTSNVVMLCRRCHPNESGTPSWRVGIDFVKTIGFGDYDDASLSQ